MRFDDENDEDLKPENWMLTDENMVLRGLVTLNLEANELAVRKALCGAIQLKYPAVGCNDIVFLKANRRKLTEPVNCDEFSFKLDAYLRSLGLYVGEKLWLLLHVV